MRQGRAAADLLGSIAMRRRFSAEFYFCSYVAYTILLSINVFLPRSKQSPVLVAARSVAWVHGRSLVGIVGSNPAGGMDVCFVSVLCDVR